MKKSSILALVFCFAFSGPAMAEIESGADIKLRVDKESFLDTDFLETSIIINSASSTYNAVFLSIMFDNEYLALEELSKDADFCSMTVHSGFDNSIGYAFLICGNPEGNASSSLAIADLRFRKIKEGQAKINLTNSQIISNDGLAKNILEQGDIHSIEIIKTGA